MNAKQWNQSKTIWFNIFIAVLTVLCSSIELLRQALPDVWYLGVSMLAAGVNVWLRTKTTVPLGGKS